MQPDRAWTSCLGVPLLPLAQWVGWVAPACPTHGVPVLSCPSADLRVCGVLDHLAPVHRCARSVRCVVSAVSRATWLLFTGAPIRCVALLVRCPGPLGSCSPVCSRGLSCCVCGVLGHLTAVHRCARSVCSVVCGVSWVSWLLFTGVSAWCAALCVRCPGPLGSCSPVCLLGALRCVCGVQGHLAPVHRCARSVRCFACAVSWATWLLFTGVLALFVVLRVRCPGPLGSCSPVRPLGVLCCVWGVLGHLAPVHRCVRLVCCFVCAVSWAIWLLFTGVPGRGVPSLCCPSCLCVRGVLAQVAPVHRRARCVRCACAVGGCVSLPPPLICFFFFRAFSSHFFFSEKIDETIFFKFFTKKGARVHCRHKHGQLVQWCNSVVFSGVCRQWFGGRAPGVRLARPDVHGYGSG